MAGASIRIDVTDNDIQSGLAAIDRVAQNPSAIMADISAFMVTATQRHIERETGPDGAKWPRLSPRTAARRIDRKRRGHENILRVTGRLYQSLTDDSGRDYAAAGTNLVYGGIHQFGGTIQIPAREQDIHFSTGRGRRRFVKAGARHKETRRVTVGAHSVTIPARPYLYLNEGDRAEVLEIVADGLRRETGGVLK